MASFVDEQVEKLANTFSDLEVSSGDDKKVPKASFESGRIEKAKKNVYKNLPGNIKIILKARKNAGRQWTKTKDPHFLQDMIRLNNMIVAALIKRREENKQLIMDLTD